MVLYAERIETDDHCRFDLAAATIVACGTVSSSRCSDIIVKGISAPPIASSVIAVDVDDDTKDSPILPFNKRMLRLVSEGTAEQHGR
jgi:hypothetical protein